jgi:integrase
MPRLTKRLIDSLHPDPAGKERFVWDEGDSSVKGFGIRIMAGGTASYLVQYRNSFGQTRRLGIGRVGVLTPEEARTLAVSRLSEVQHGGDPSATRKALRCAISVADLIEVYLKDGPIEKPRKKPSSWATDRSNLTRHVLPLLGTKIAKTLTSQDISRFQSDVAAGKTAADVKTKIRGRAIVKGGRGIASRTLAVLGAMLAFAERRALITKNPARGVEPFKGPKSERFLTSAEVARLADAINSLERQGINRNATNAVRLLLLTGARKGEILQLRWEQIDVERRCLRLADSKTGPKIVPVGQAALDLLASIQGNQTFGWVFPGTGVDSHYTGLQKIWVQLRDLAGLPAVRLHDLRHSYASFAVSDGASLLVVGKILGHAQSRTTEIYAHLADDPVRALAHRTANRIQTAMNAGSMRSNVIGLRKHRT